MIRLSLVAPWSMHMIRKGFHRICRRSKHLHGEEQSVRPLWTCRCMEVVLR